MKSYFFVNLHMPYNLVSTVRAQWGSDSGFGSTVIPASGLMNSYTTMQFGNNSSLFIRITEYRYMSRADRVSTTAQDNTLLTDPANFEFGYNSVPANYPDWPEAGHPYENQEFWRYYIPLKPRTRIVKPGTVGFFNSYKRAMFDHLLLKSAETANTVIKGVTVRAVYTLQPEHGSQCVESGVATATAIRPGHALVTARLLNRTKSRFIDYNQPDIRGSNNTANYEVLETGRMIVPANGHELHVAPSREDVEQDGTGPIYNQRNVNINLPSNTCTTQRWTPDVAVSNTPLPVEQV